MGSITSNIIKYGFRLPRQWMGPNGSSSFQRWLLAFVVAAISPTLYMVTIPLPTLLTKLVEGFQSSDRARISSPLQSFRRDEVVNWKFPQEGRVKVNADGSSLPGPKVDSTVGDLRNENGAWLGGFQVDMGYACSSAMGCLAWSSLA